MKYKLHQEKTVFSSPYIKVKIQDVTFNGKNVKEYNVVEFMHDSVVVVLVRNDEILFTKNYRFVVNEILIELPQGAFDVGENAIEAASRELYEETGIIGTNYKDIGYFYPTCGISTQKIHAVSAEYLDGDIKVQQDEIEDAFWLSIAEVKNMMTNNTFVDAATLICLTNYFAMVK